MTHTFQANTDNKVSEHIYKSPIEGLYFIENKKFTDERGFYAEISHIPELEQAIGFNFHIKQQNLSLSQQNVIRGFHAENWNKLVTVVSGSAYCVLADIRKDSPTFGQSVQVNLGDGETDFSGSMFISSGIANSFLVLKGPVNYFYSVDQLYSERDKSHDVAINLFDPQLNINWPIPKEEMIISERDKSSINLSNLVSSSFKKNTFS